NEYAALGKCLQLSADQSPVDVPGERQRLDDAAVRHRVSVNVPRRHSSANTYCRDSVPCVAAPVLLFASMIIFVVPVAVTVVSRFTRIPLIQNCPEDERSIFREPLV